MQISVSRTVPMSPWLLLGGGLCLILFVTAVSIYFPSTVVPGLQKQVIPSLLIFALLVGFLIFLRPEVGVLFMIAMVLFRPEIFHGKGITTIIELVLGGILMATIAVRKQLWFLRVHQVQILFLIGILILINWYFVGQVEAPSNLSSSDLTTRVLGRSVFQLAFLIFFVSFIRTPRHLLLATALFLFAVFLTIPGAISHSATAVGKAEQIRAAATAGIEAAENANRLAFICLMGISLIWFALIEYRSKLLRIVGGLAIPPLVLTIFMTGSRSGLLMLIILGPLLLWQSNLRWGQIMVIFLLLALISTLSVTFVPQRVLDRISSFSPTSESAHVSSSTLSLQRRLLMIYLGFKLFGGNPFFGAGIGNVRWMNALDPASGGIPMSLHNSYLLTLAEGGIILLGAYFLLFWKTFWDLGNALKWSTYAPQIGLRWLILATRTNLILLLTFSFFAETWKELYYLLILATTGVLYQLYQKAAEQSWIRSRSST